MATAPSDNGEYTHFEATEDPSECSRNLQAAENEPRPARLPEAEDSSSHWHNVTATFSTQHERTGSRSLGHSPLLNEKTRVLESRWSAMAEANRVMYLELGSGAE